MDSVWVDIYFLLLLYLKAMFPFLFLSGYLCLIPVDCIYNIAFTKICHFFRNYLLFSINCVQSLISLVSGLGNSNSPFLNILPFYIQLAYIFKVETNHFIWTRKRVVTRPCFFQSFVVDFVPYCLSLCFVNPNTQLRCIPSMSCMLYVWE